MQAGIVQSDCCYTKSQLAAVLGVSEDTLERVLADLYLRPYRSGTSCPLISGAAFCCAVQRRQAEVCAKQKAK